MRPLPSGSYRLPAYCLVCLLMSPLGSADSSGRSQRLPACPAPSVRYSLRTDKKTRVRSRQGFPARPWLRSGRCLPGLIGCHVPIISPQGLSCLSSALSVPDPVGRCLPVLYSSLNVFPVSFRMDSGRSEQIKRIYLYIFIYSFIPSAGPEGLRLPAFPVCPQVLPIASG